MTPASPVIPGEEIEEIIIAEDQPPYKPLPAIVGEDGTVLTRWKCSIWDRLRILLTGNIYLWIMTFGNQLQPVQLDTSKPTYTTIFTFRGKLKDWFNRNFNLSRKYGWIKTPGGWLCWDFGAPIPGAPRVYWSKD